MFKNRFIETIGAREDLEARHKFQYLLQYFDGEPLRHANGYLITDENYYLVLDHMENRYGDKATLATLLAQDFVNMREIGPRSQDLRQFHDAVLRLTNQMEQIKQDVDGNILWRQAMLSKMSKPLRTKIVENLGQDPMSAPIRDILERISDHARILEKSEVCVNWRTPTNGNSGRDGQLCRHAPRCTPQRAGADAAGAGERRCAYCGRNH